MTITARIQGKIERFFDHGYPVEKRRVFVNGKECLLEDSLKIVYHSPGGFHWGYGGSGPAQTALAILLALFDEKKALELHQGFKWNVIAKLDINQEFDMTIPVTLELPAFADST